MSAFFNTAVLEILISDELFGTNTNEDTPEKHAEYDWIVDGSWSWGEHRCTRVDVIPMPLEILAIADDLVP